MKEIQPIFWTDKARDFLPPSKTVPGEVGKTIVEMYLTTIELAGLVVANAALYLIDEKDSNSR